MNFGQRQLVNSCYDELPNVLPVILQNKQDSFQQLLDRIDDLLKKINFNKELIDSYDAFFKSQSSTAHELRYSSFIIVLVVNVFELTGNPRGNYIMEEWGQLLQ